jgi:hypothetical protein
LLQPEIFWHAAGLVVAMASALEPPAYLEVAQFDDIGIIQCGFQERHV